MQDTPADTATAPTWAAVSGSKTEFLTKEAKVIKLDFIAKPGGAYEIKENGMAKSILVFNKDNDDINGKKMAKQDYYLVEFALDDQSGLKLSFAPNPMHALWVQFGTPSNPPPCPTAACHSDEFFAVCVDQGAKKLTIRNEDTNIADFSFTLRFLPEGADPKNPSSYVEYDPIGSNQNGGR
jgi:hypothetical protein